MMDLTTIQSKIYELRGERVMMDSDLAKLYGVETKVLNQAVRRNRERFPEDFMFELTEDEHKLLITSLRSHFVTSNRGGNRYVPYAFTEQGVAMLSSVLRSKRAIEINISIMRAFVAMRRFLMTATFQNRELEELKQRVQALERSADNALGAVNDLSEDIRKELDDIYVVITALSQKDMQTQKREKVGFKK